MDKAGTLLRRKHVQLDQRYVTRTITVEVVNSEVEFSALEDISDPLERLRLLLDVCDILKDMVWFYNEFPEQRNTKRHDTDDDISNEECNEKWIALSETKAMENLLDVISPSIQYILSSLSHRGRDIALTGVSPILFPRSVEPIILMETTENSPLEIQDINNRLSHINEDLFSIEGYLQYVNPMDQETDGGNISPNKLEYLRKAFIDDKPLWNIVGTIYTENISFLLFDDEKIRMKAMLDKGIDPQLHLGSIATPLVYASDKEEEATFEAIKAEDLLPIALKAINYYKKEDNESSNNHSMITSTISIGKKGLLKACLHLKEIAFYLFNVGSDIKTGYEYIQQKEYVLGILTILCLFLPILAETASKLILKILGWGKKFGGIRWHDLPPHEFIESFRRMAKNFTYTYRANTTYNELEKIYSKLHYYRCIKGHQRFEKNPLKENSTKIQDLCLALSNFNQLVINQWLLAESMWEDAPQLLIQMTALLTKKWDSDIWKIIWPYLTTVKSLGKLSFAMSNAHQNIHKSNAATIWRDDFPFKASITEVSGYLLIYGTRFFSISVIFGIIPGWFTISAVIYLAILYCLLTFVGKRSNHYRKLHGLKTTAFWPLARFYTIPHTIGVWRLDSLDHILFYLETLFMGAFIPYIFSKDKLPSFNINSPIFECVVVSCAVVSILILFVFKKWLHRTNHLCDKVNEIAPPSDPNKIYNDINKEFI